MGLKSRVWVFRLLFVVFLGLLSFVVVTQRSPASRRFLEIADIKVYKQSPKDNELIAEYDSSPKQGREVNLRDLEDLLDVSVFYTRTNEHGQIDWSQYTHMVMYHTRKAGGSSLYYWAKKVAKKHNLTIHQQEGNTYDPHDWRMFNREQGQRVFVFTSLRPPVDRVISSYQYDGIQTAKDLNKTITLQEFFDNANFVNNYGKNVRSVKRRGVMGNKKKTIRVKRGWVWKCATNCYSKWFGGWPTKDLIPNTYEAAKRLNELEILWMHSYKEPRYMDWILHRWNATDIPMEHRRKTKNKAKQNYTKAEIKMLQEANWQDQLLYTAMQNKWTRMLNTTLS